MTWWDRWLEEVTAFRFEDPLWLLALLLLPVLALLRGKTGQTAAVRFPSIALAKQVAAFVRSRPGRFFLPLRLFGLLFLILALARPQLGTGSTRIDASGIDIVLAIDVSSSMLALDFDQEQFELTRLDAVKEVVAEFVRERSNDRLGLVAFAGNPYLVSPLTLNHGWLDKNLERLRVGLIEDGTAIGSALAMSVNRLRNLEDADSRVVILLTDGVNNRGDITPVAAAEAARAYGTKVYTIAAGEGGTVPTLVFDPRTGDVARNRRGQRIVRTQPSPVDVETLQEIARITGGRFFQAGDQEGLREIYREIDELEKSEVTLNVSTLYRDIFFLPALAGLLLIGLEQVLRYTKYRRVP